MRIPSIVGSGRFFHLSVLAMASFPRLETTLSDWTPTARNQIKKLIQEGAGRGKLAFFDFDNTILCRDIGDATLAVLVRDGKITPESIRKLSSPEFHHGGRAVCPEDGVLQYSDQLHRATSGDGSTCSAIGYAWQVQLLNGLTVADIVAATRKAYCNGLGAHDAGTLSITTVPPTTDAAQSLPVAPPPDGDIGSKAMAMPAAPFFHAGMVELLAELLDHGYDVRIVSASNIWCE
jgi:hypothetical protein